MKTHLALAISIALWAATASGAEILDRTIRLDLRPDGFTETTDLLVEITESGDLNSWSEYALIIDDEIELLEANIEITEDGETIKKIPKRKWREETSVGFGLHTSAGAKVADLPMLAIGQQLKIKTVREWRPYFKGHWLVLQLESPQRRLSIQINGGGENLRFEIHDPDDLFSHHQEGNRLILSGTDIPSRDEPNYAGAAFSVSPRLRLAWDSSRSWSDIAQWYATLIAGVDVDAPSIRELASELTEDLGSRRDKAIALADYVKHKIRYEAVEIGVGGWIPTPAAEVAERGWGDCKDKSLLLKELLESIGVVSRLTLLHLGREGRIDPNFPSTIGFNHCILAVQAEGISDPDSDHVVRDWILVDPTMDRGVALWLSPYIQGQWVLVTGNDGGQLLQLPEDFGSEGRVLNVKGRVDESGAFSGTATIRFFGSRALRWIRDLDRAAAESIEADLRQVVETWLPGSQTGRVTWEELEEHSAPAMQLQAEVSIPGLLRGSSSRLRFRPALLGFMPDARDLEDRDEPVVLNPGVQWTRWELTLPEGICPVEPIDEAVENSVGEVRTQVSQDNEGLLVVDHRAILRRSWIVPAAVPQLEELTIAEKRRLKRSIRFKCTEADPQG